ncbi:PREDICTED: ADP-ribosylation factor-binding protein GGA1-like [Priapulus caudatus]|uniref:ADP-ribosylation factor-binding protein GGA1-like n=1 Tax=Priapulus caudatus TaxID=37621 RepID=A0ABM1EK36_PRICU|nr:PREDICTED: ADP-ribosylation factor-binding protein GGA1-like [Priapulus caudatus]
MAASDSLENIFNQITNPVNCEENWEQIITFCDQVNREHEGPQTACKLISHKIQSPQEWEALIALSVLEHCAKNCEKRFHQEIGKFRFLNEMIKLVSPKYLGNKTSPRVHVKVIELMYQWTLIAPHEPKIKEAYEMLKRQGIVKQDPILPASPVRNIQYGNTGVVPPSPRRNELAIDADKQKLLSKLLKSRNPDDLQAANRLIKNLVREDAAKSEKVSKRISDLETVGNNAKLLADMLSNYSSATASAEDRELMKELYVSCDKLRPSLFRLASETDDDAIGDVLKANDELTRVMERYKAVIIDDNPVQLVADARQENGERLLGSTHKGAAGPSLLDLDTTSTSQAAQIADSALLDADLSAMGMSEFTNDSMHLTPAKTAATQKSASSLSELDDIFSVPGTATQPANSNVFDDFVSASVSAPAAPRAPLYHTPPHVTLPPVAALPSGPPPAYPAPSTFSTAEQVRPTMAAAVVPTQSLLHGTSEELHNVFLQSSSHYSAAAAMKHDPGELVGPMPMVPQQAVSTSPAKSSERPVAKGLDELDAIGQKLIEQQMPIDMFVSGQNKFQPPRKTPMNLMQKSAPAVSATMTAASSAITKTTSTPTSPAQVLPLTDLFIHLENVQPGTLSPLNVYDKGGLRTVMHFAKNAPREDVAVMVVSTINMNTVSVKGFTFQAAVPKVMKVKLQPASAADLPAFNPILPPAAITQVMLLANPLKEKIKLKYKITYLMNDNQVVEVGDVENFPIP